MREISYKMKRTNSGPLKKNNKHHFNATMMESPQRIKQSWIWQHCSFSQILPALVKCPTNTDLGGKPPKEGSGVNPSLGLSICRANSRQRCSIIILKTCYAPKARKKCDFSFMYKTRLLALKNKIWMSCILYKPSG